MSYNYVEHGGTAEASRQLGVDHHQVVKTLIMEDEHAKPLVILMHGDCEVSTKNLARQTAAKALRPANPSRRSAIPAIWSEARVPSVRAR